MRNTMPFYEDLKVADIRLMDITDGGYEEVKYVYPPREMYYRWPVPEVELDKVVAWFEALRDGKFAYKKDVTMCLGNGFEEKREEVHHVNVDPADGRQYLLYINGKHFRKGEHCEHVPLVVEHCSYDGGSVTVCVNSNYRLDEYRGDDYIDHCSAYFDCLDDVKDVARTMFSRGDGGMRLDKQDAMDLVPHLLRVWPDHEDWHKLDEAELRAAIDEVYADPDTAKHDRW